MAATITPPHTTARTPRVAKVRTALGIAISRGAEMASAAKHQHRRPALTITGFGLIDAATWLTFGLGAGLGALGIAVLAFDALSDDE